MEGCNKLSDGDLNPKVQIELEKLNTTSDQINKFENNLQDLRNNFNETLSKCSARLTELADKIGPAISQARQYYECKWNIVEVQRESQVAASRYETACIEMSHAIAVVNKHESLAKGTSQLDDSAMEILNIAIAKVNMAKTEKVEAHREHQKYLSIFINLDEKIRFLEKKYKNDIKKSCDYFTFSKKMDDKLKEDKLNIEAYEEKIRICKSLYNESLQRLEEISNKIHEERQCMALLGPRGEGVGAEVASADSIADARIASPISVTKSISQQKVHVDISDNDSAVSAGATSHYHHHHRHIEHRSSVPNITKSKLTSSTPITDGLRKAVLESQTKFNFTALHHTLPRDFPAYVTTSKEFSVASKPSSLSSSGSTLG